MGNELLYYGLLSFFDYLTKGFGLFIGLALPYLLLKSALDR